MAIYLSLIFLLIYARPGHAEIGASSDLNCDFGSLCRWRNVTGSADSGDFGISNRVEPGPGTFIMPMEEGDESGFAYTMGLMGRTVALLVSEVVNCQLGGASLQYWYYKTGPAASLEVCIRQPPGNLEPTGLRCYEGASPNYGRVWSFRAIELPPIGQPFELIFRSYYSPPTDIIALDNITYSAALCPENSTQLTHHSAIRPKRSPPLIGIKDWEAYRRSQHYKGEPMIIVAQDVGQPTTTTPSTTTTFDFERSALLGTHFVFKDPILQPTSTTTTTILPSSSSPTSTATEPPKSSSTTSTTELPSTSSESSTIISTTAVTTTSNPNQGSDSIENFVKFIKQTAPVLPYIPSFVRSLTGLDPRYASAAIGSADLSNSAAFTLPEAPPTLIPEIPEIPDMRRAPVHTTQIYHTDMDTSQINNNNPSTEDSESLLSIAEKAGIISSSDLKTTMLPPIVPMNAYGLGATKLPIKKTKDVVPIYPRGLVRSKSKTFKSDSDLAEHERIKGLKKDWDNPEKLLAKVFKAATTSHPELVQRPQLRPKANTQPTTTQPLTIFKNPLPVENEVAGKLASLTKNLSPTQLNEIKMLRNIPDFQGLVKGMDFSLITKGNAGYQALKNEFIRRLMMRNLGLPFATNETKIAPKPIVPVKVTRRMMAEKQKRLMLNRERRFNRKRFYKNR